MQSTVDSFVGLCDDRFKGLVQGSATKVRKVGF